MEVNELGVKILLGSPNRSVEDLWGIIRQTVSDYNNLRGREPDIWVKMEVLKSTDDYDV